MFPRGEARPYDWRGLEGAASGRSNQGWDLVPKGNCDFPGSWASLLITFGKSCILDLERKDG